MNNPTITIKGRQVEVPRLTLKRFADLRNERETIRKGSAESGWEDAVAKIIHAAVSRKDSGVTVDEVAESIEVGKELNTVLRHIFGNDVEEQLEKKEPVPTTATTSA